MAVLKLLFPLQLVDINTLSPKIRHPGYSANMLLWLPYSALVTPHVYSLLLQLVLFIVAYSRRIPAEEAMMYSERGPAYTEYARRVPARLIPFVL